MEVNTGDNKKPIIQDKKKLIGAKNVKTFARKNQTNCDEFATLEFILPKYKKYNEVIEKPEKIIMPKYFENDHEIVLETPGKINNRFYL